MSHVLSTIINNKVYKTESYVENYANSLVFFLVFKRKVLYLQKNHKYQT